MQPTIINNLVPEADNDWTPGRGGNNIEYIILHTSDSSVHSADSTFHTLNSGRSAHRIVGLDGSITVEVGDGDTAWGAANWYVNQRGLNLEHEDNGNYDDAVRTDAEYNASAWQVADWCRRYKVPCKKVSVDGNHNPVEAGILLHNEVSQTGTACPDGLDWERIIRQAQAIIGGVVPVPQAAPASPDYSPVNQTVTVTVPTLFVRVDASTDTAAGQANTPDGNIHEGNIVTVTGWKHGQIVNGNDIWLRSVWGHWFFSGGTDFNYQQYLTPAPTPVAVDPEPVEPAAPIVVQNVVNEWEQTYVAKPDKLEVLTQSIAHAFDGSGPDKTIYPGQPYDIAGIFSVGGVGYARTKYGLDHGTWYGLPLTAFVEPVSAVKQAAMQPIISPTAAKPVDAVMPPAAEVLPESAVVGSLTPSEEVAGLVAKLYGLFIKLASKFKKGNK